MNKFVIVLMLIAAAFIPVSAQETENPAPGLYHISAEGQLEALTFQRGAIHSSGTSIAGLEVGRIRVKYRGLTSDSPVASGDFLMVCDPDRSAITTTLKKYFVFVRTITPENMILVPLYVKKNHRFYNEGHVLEGIPLDPHHHLAFTWEQTGPYQYRIHADLPAGEYAFVFKPVTYGGLDYDALYNFGAVFDFTIQ